ncbi:MAG TPA: ABC transporter permease [Flavilitoribacter sp.]|nr:ABC transporter permease [Flavilitoribacter sp.]
MFIHSLKITLRSLIRQGGYTLINILGLTLGFTCCLLIGTYVHFELSHDQYHAKKDRIVRMAAKVDGASFENGIAKVTFNWGEAARSDIPEVERVCRFLSYGEALVQVGDERFYQEGGLFADSTVFDVFSWRLSEGDPYQALTRPNSIILTEPLAERCFGDRDPMGQVIRLDNGPQYTVTGVMPAIPENSHFNFTFLASMSSYTHPDLLDWVRWNQFYTYLLLEPGAARETVAKKMDRILDGHLDAENARATYPLLQPLTSIHLHSNLFRELSVNSDIRYVYIFGSIALLILVIAALNFINLSTARASARAREVGVRKVTGASRWSLIEKFMGEALMVCTIGAVLSAALAKLLLPSLNLILGSNLRMNWLDNGWLPGGLLAATLITALLSGFYPAFVLSSFKPENAIKGESAYSGNTWLRKGLVVFQFLIASLLITAAITVNDQLQYIQHKNLGFNKEQILVAPMAGPESRRKADAMKAEFAQVPGVLDVSLSANRPGGTDYGIPYQAVGVDPNQQPAMRCLVVDDDFLGTYGMELAAGRGFSKDMPTDSAGYLINEEAARQLGWTGDSPENDPLNQQMAMPAIGRPAGPVLGVVKDFHFRSLHEQISPLYFFKQPAWFSQFSIKLDAAQVDETLAGLTEVWRKFEPEFPFACNFFDEQFDNLHQREANTARVVRWFTLIAILITCLGLFGLSTYMAQQRSKEIGIRKVLGASVPGIIGLLSRDFLKLVAAGLVLAIPAAWYFMGRWLDNFAYRIDLSWWIFALTAAAALLIALVTVSYQSIRAALMNPVDSLRDE